MVDSLLSVDSVVVTGGPATVKLSTDFGPQGDRGSLILYGLDKPNNLNIEDFPQSPLLLDWYINLKTTDSEYLYLYQYQNKDGIDQWVKIFKILPNVYNTNENVTFTAGVATTTLYISNTTAPLLGSSGTIKLNTHIDVQSASGNPIACSFVFGSQTFDSLTQSYVLPITINATEYNMTSNTWAKVTGAAVAHISINVV